MKCGKEANTDEAFCRYCGVRLAEAERSSRTGAPQPPVSAVTHDVISEEELATFIGKNADRYLVKFRKFTALGRGSFVMTWHWPAFFFGSFWMLYRKLYLWAFVALAVGFIPGVGILALFVLGLTGNYLYFTAARSRIQGIQAQQALSPVERAAAIARAGGTNSTAIFLVPLFAVMVLGIIAAIAIPSFVSYRQRSYDVQARTEVQDACRRLADIFVKEPGLAEVTPEDLLNTGFSPSPDIEMMLLDGRRETFGLSAQHREGKKTYITDAACLVREELKGPSEQI